MYLSDSETTSACCFNVSADHLFSAIAALGSALTAASLVVQTEILHRLDGLPLNFYSHFTEYMNP